MDKIYNPKEIEQSIYQYWEKEGFFKPNYNLDKESYCIMMPPPNITGNLHMGHAFQQTIMDTLIRYHRMQGKNTLWQVGTDHAGIATQIIIEHKIFSEENKRRLDYTRTEFINKVLKWNSEINKIITYQMRRLGNSVDWTRERFTMDEKFSNSVKEAFIRLYNENLIYRKKRLVNWDPKLCTAISDLEVDNRETNGLMWYIRYPLYNTTKFDIKKSYITVATTRPETIFGDTAVAVHPKDLRYNKLIGQFVLLPILNRKVPIIGDSSIDINKGTGCVKITPAHDFNDYEIAKKHMLPMINILTVNGCIRQKVEVFYVHSKFNNNINQEIPSTFCGLDRFIARKIILKELKRLNLLEKVKSYKLILPYSNRSNAIIEPMLINQWYINVSPLSKIAIEAVKNGKIKFIPKSYEKIYFNWMNKIEDWCISRQLWWGHRIPAWYDNNHNIYVGINELDIRNKYNLNEELILHQDEDVLDTWFSSSLWTFSSLGWPNYTKELHTFHPTNVIVSGFDIIFFWIARMIMLTMHFIKDKFGNPQVPFKTVYITGIIRDENKQKMSKSKGNIIDPIDLIDGITLSDLLKKRTSNMMQPNLIDKILKDTRKKFPSGIKPHGADALRLFMLALSSTGRDISLDINRLKGYKKFCNKLWNASRFVLINTVNKDCGISKKTKIFSLADRWILTKFNKTVQLFTEAISNYRFDLATNILYDFTWHKFCDWYLELSKPILNIGNNYEKRGTRYTLIKVLENLLYLSHPIIPFITESIWQKVKTITGTDGITIMTKSFPSYNKSMTDTEAEQDLEFIKELICKLRIFRKETNIQLNQLINLSIYKPESKILNLIDDNKKLIFNLCNIKDIDFTSESCMGRKFTSCKIGNKKVMFLIRN